jgi:hypothetical protein
MSASPQYVGTPKSPTVTISTANTNRDGATGTYGTLMTAGASGARIDRLRITALGTTTAGMVRLFVGTALIYEIPVVAVTPSGTQPAWAADIVFDGGLILAASTVLKANTHNAESFAITAISAGDF